MQTPSLILATSLSFGDVLISFKGLQFMLIMLLWQNSPEMPSKNRASMRSIHLKKGFLIASNIACKHSTLYHLIQATGLFIYKTSDFPLISFYLVFHSIYQHITQTYVEAH